MKDKLDELMDGFLDIGSPDALREKIMMKTEFKTRKNRNTARLAVLMGSAPCLSMVVQMVWFSPLPVSL
ncbi:hypothetical protein IM774_10330 [Erysipelotrichaceae bacterium RD49]|nr:hypothetical protein [Erysipelotrichaceae bacterium RD49]